MENKFNVVTSVGLVFLVILNIMFVNMTYKQYSEYNKVIIYILTKQSVTDMSLVELAQQVKNHNPNDSKPVTAP